MRKQTRFLTLALALFLAAAPLSRRGTAADRPPPLHYTVTHLGRLPASYSEYSRIFVWRINNHGQVVGTAYAEMPSASDPPPDKMAFLWQRGRMQVLKPLPGYRNSEANCINDHGQIVGNLSGSDQGHTRAFVWRNGQMRLLATLPGSRASSACAINDRGQIVGSLGNEAVLWSGGKIHDLGQGLAVDINNRGDVVGIKDITDRSDPNRLPDYLDGPRNRIFLWHKGHRYDLGRGIARRINDKGQIIGYSSHLYDTTSFLWQKGRRLDLGSLGQDNGNKPYCLANSINNKGQIVGTSSTRNFTGVQAFFWQKGRMNALSPTNFRLSWAVALNDLSQIVGYGAQGWVLLTPVSHR